MAEIEGGYVFVARKIQQSEIWKRPPECLKVWIYILQEVNHGDRRAFPRGTNFFNYHDVARSCLLKYSTVDNWMRWLKSTGHITARKTTRGTIVTVLNYDKYQTSGSYEYGTNYGTVHETEAEQLRNGTGTINKNVKNGRTKECREAVAEASALTPFQEAKNFFEKPEERIPFLDVMTSKGISETVAVAEMEKFVGHWTEPNATGKRQRWELERTFQIRRRISKWAANIRQPAPGGTSQTGEWTCKAGTRHSRFQGCACPSGPSPEAAAYADIPEISEEERTRNLAALAEVRRRLTGKLTANK